MITLGCNKIPRFFQAGPAFTLLFAFFLIIMISANAEDKPTDKGAESRKIHITADRLVSDTNAMVAEFSGNVRATQEKTVITSESLKIYYNDSLKDNNKAAGKKGSIRKIIAEGNVEIHFDNRVAVTDQAVYTTDSRILVLSGENSKITTENNYITGKKITIHRDDGRITFERSTNEPVKAVIHTDKNGLN